MTTSGEDGARSEEARRALGKDYPDWMIGRRGQVFYAWYPAVPKGPNGLMVLRDFTVPRLRLRVEKFEEVFEATNSRDAAEAAALGLET